MSKTALLFAGQGAQAVGMGRDFCERLPAAQAWFERANTALGYDLAGICFNGPEAELTRTENCQPGIFLVSWVAFEMLSARVPGLQFHATAGLSLGELTALAVADALPFEAAIRAIRLRGRCMQEACDVTQGGMAAVLGLDEAQCREVCVAADVELANLNCPGQIVLSGETGKIDRAIEIAKQRGAKRALPLTVAGAYHSRLMASAKPRFAAELARLSFQSPRSPVISNVTARPHGSPDEIRSRLVDQITSPVRWEESIRYLLSQGFTRFIELGPGTALSGFMKRIDKNAQALNVADLPSLEATSKALTG